MTLLPILMQRTAYILLMLILSISCKKEVAAPVLDNKYDEASSAYVPTPNLNTAPISDILALSAKSGGTFENDYGKPVTAKGICWGLAQNPTVGGSCTSEGPNTTSFTSDLTVLLADTVYYVRAYATNEAGTIYGGQRSFRTRDGVATFSGLAVTNVTSSGASVAVTVDQEGGDSITARGVCYSTQPDPTTGGTCIASGTGTGAVSVTITGLDRTTAYYVRPYATNAVLTTYGAQVSFVTTADLPTVVTGNVNGITSNSATVAREVTATGGATVTAGGVCISTTQNPTISDTCVSSGPGTGTFSAVITDLNAGVTYFVRAYATNSAGTAYGSNVQFTTAPGLPTVITGSVSTISGTGATVAGDVTAAGGATVTARGVCYATTQNPTTSGTCLASGSGMGTFSATLTALIPATIYYVRAYATNIEGTSYGAQTSFTSLPVPPTVTTGAITNITSNSASAAGNVTATGGATVTGRGVCYATTQNPSTANPCIASGSGTGTFSAVITGLSTGVTYFVRAYATNSAGTNYGSQIEFKTLATSLPVISTSSISEVSTNSATANAFVSSSGSSSVTSRGVCYSTLQNPTTSSSCVNSGSGTGSFSVTLSPLSSNTTYYARAYATSDVGTYYGSQIEFKTLAILTTLSTPTFSNVLNTSFRVTSTVNHSGSSLVTSRGVCHSLTFNFFNETCVSDSSSGVGTFHVNVSGLVKNTTYYVRAFAIISGTKIYSQYATRTTLNY